MEESLNYEQGSDEWHAFRKKGIGASDCAAILGISPWKTAFQLWEEKIGIATNNQENFAMRFGNLMEPRARADFELRYEFECPPILAIHKDYKFLRASLDGYNEKLNVVLEIKCPGRKAHDSAQNGVVPDYYMCQLQHQLLVTGADKVYYYSCFSENRKTTHPIIDDTVCIEVYPDNDYIKTLLAAEIEFWNNVQTLTPPELSANDIKKMDDPEIVALAEKYRTLDAEEKKNKLDKDKVKKELFNLVDHPKAKIGDILQVCKFYKRGAVDYSNIPELGKVNLDDYRKPVRTENRITLLKKK